MNCEQHNSNPQTDNELICTVCSPKTTREQLANNPNQPMESDCSLNSNEELFTEFSPEIPRGEEVCVLKNSKKCAKTKKATRSDGLLISRRICAQAAGLDFAAFFVFAAAFLRLM
jgi:hypothetical protein